MGRRLFTARTIYNGGAITYGAPPVYNDGPIMAAIVGPNSDISVFGLFSANYGAQPVIIDARRPYIGESPNMALIPPIRVVPLPDQLPLLTAGGLPNQSVVSGPQMDVMLYSAVPYIVPFGRPRMTILCPSDLGAGKAAPSWPAFAQGRRRIRITTYNPNTTIVPVKYQWSSFGNLLNLSDFPIVDSVPAKVGLVNGMFIREFWFDNFPTLDVDFVAVSAVNGTSHIMAKFDLDDE